MPYGRKAAGEDVLGLIGLTVLVLAAAGCASTPEKAVDVPAGEVEPVVEVRVAESVANPDPGDDPLFLDVRAVHDGVDVTSKLAADFEGGILRCGLRSVPRALDASYLLGLRAGIAREMDLGASRVLVIGNAELVILRAGREEPVLRIEYEVEGDADSVEADAVRQVLGKLADRAVRETVSLVRERSRRKRVSAIDVSSSDPRFSARDVARPLARELESLPGVESVDVEYPEDGDGVRLLARLGPEFEGEPTKAVREWLERTRTGSGVRFDVKGGE